MEKNEINQKGFTKISLLITIIAYIVIASIITTGAILYKNKTGRLKPTASVSESIEGSKNTSQIEQDLENLRKEVEILKNQEPKIIPEDPHQNEDLYQNNEYDISSLIQKWRNYIAYIECTWENLLGKNVVYRGSGLFKSVGVVTNLHVISQTSYTGEITRPKYCIVVLPDDQEVFVNEENIYKWSDEYDYDIGFLFIQNQTQNMQNLARLNPPICENKALIGDEILILGYPIIGSRQDITVTEGIISGYEGGYYITSAKIEQGNSGGAAILIKGDCWLGIPTFAELGNIESLGRILDSRLLYQD